MERSGAFYFLVVGSVHPYVIIGPQGSAEIRAVHLNASLKEAAQLMQQWRVGSLSVIDDRSQVGVVTDTDLV